MLPAAPIVVTVPSPVGLSSASLSWRDPATTTPAGRLQADARTHYYGGLAVRDNPSGLLGPDGQPLCGLSVDLCGLTQTGPDTGTATVTGVSDPPAGYKNPLRVSNDGCLWFDPANVVTYYLPACTTASVPSQSILGGTGNRDLGSPVTVCITNDCPGPAVVRRTIKVLNASIIDPPPSAGSGGRIDFQVALPEYNVNSVPTNGGVTPGTATPKDLGAASITCAQIANCDDARSEVLYFLTVDGGFDIHVLRAGTNQSAATSITFELDEFVATPGGTHTMTVTPRLAEFISPLGTYTVFPGQIQVCMQLVCLPPGSSVQQTPGCP